LRFGRLLTVKLVAVATTLVAMATALPRAFTLEDPRDRAIAAQFAPIFHQGLGSSPRFDYITNFDFDGDWRGDNNWRNAANQRFALRAYIYYSVAETDTHFFVHYAAFHPRDYKGGSVRGALASKGIRKGVERLGRFDPTGRADEAVLAHENDLEGALVVAEKRGASLAAARVVFVQTLAHNQFLRYVPAGISHAGADTVPMEAQRPRLFIEPRGHGIEAWRGDEAQLSACENGVLIYNFTGRAEAPRGHSRPVGYDLVPLASTLWPRAQGGPNETYAETNDYGTVQVATTTDQRAVALGELGSAFRGSVGGNMARPPWGWFDGRERDRPLGEWFFQPAETVQRTYTLGADFSVTYVHHPLLGVVR
jgi:hypothetical protein